MKYPTLAATLLLAAAAPASAMTIDADERELYDNSVRCMAYFGIMAGLGGEGAPEDPESAASGTKFLAMAMVLSDEDKPMIQKDLNEEIEMFGKLAAHPDDQANVERLRAIKDECEFMETLVDAMLES